MCTHNSARSQMAEGLLRHLAGDRFEAFSAGTEKTRVRPEAAEAMREIGADISGQEPKTLDRYLWEGFDFVVTVCDDANEACPVFPGARERLHWSLPDPSAVAGDAAERMEAFRSVRDRIRGLIRAGLPIGDASGNVRAGISPRRTVLKRWAVGRLLSSAPCPKDHSPIAARTRTLP